MQFFETPEFNVAVISKNYKTSLAKAITEKFYPQIVKDRMERSLDEISEHEWKGLVPTTEHPNKNPKVALIREPIERFLSACAMGDLDVDMVIDDLKSGGYYSKHEVFSSQVGDYDRVFTADKLEDFCKYIKLSLPFPKLNVSKYKKALLTATQLIYLNDYFKADIKFYKENK